MAVGRFQVMAVLQAARAFILGLPLETSKSWGLNRAIFYAAAKRGFKGGSPMSGEFRAARSKGGEEAIDVYRLGDEMAFKEERDGRLYFTIGGQVQTEKDFERQIEPRFQGWFSEAWKDAVSFLKKFDRNILLSQNAFFQQAYKPVRDDLSSKWSELSLRRAVKATTKRRAKSL